MEYKTILEKAKEILKKEKLKSCFLKPVIPVPHGVIDAYIFAYLKEDNDVAVSWSSDFDYYTIDQIKEVQYVSSMDVLLSLNRTCRQLCETQSYVKKLEEQIKKPPAKPFSVFTHW